MQKTLSRFRWLLPVATVVAIVAAAPNARAFDPTSAAGLWQKIEDGKPTGWFLVIDHNGTFEGIIAKMYPDPGDPPNAAWYQLQKLLFGWDLTWLSKS